MCEFTSVAVQTVNPGESVIFTETAKPCNRGLVRHRDGTGSFLLAGRVPPSRNGCNCRKKAAEYFVDFGANVAIPTGGTVGEIAVALTIDGATVPTATMRSTPAAVEQYSNISRAVSIDVWNGCCETLAVRNIGTEPILIQEVNLVVTRPDLYVSM